METYFVLYDPVRERYYSNGGIGRVFARAAQPFLSIGAAEKCRDSWWKNKRFSEVKCVTLQVEAV